MGCRSTAGVRLPLVAHWGAGDVASVDGMRFIAPVSAIHAGPDPKYIGQGRGLTWNNMLSNQFSGLHGLVVPGTMRDSLVLLAIFLEQQTELEPLEIMTDTASCSDAVFPFSGWVGFSSVQGLQTSAARACGASTARPITVSSMNSPPVPSTLS